MAKSEKKGVAVIIEPLSIEKIDICIEGITPLVLNCFSDEQQEIVSDVAHNKKARGVIVDQETEYHRALYVHPDDPKKVALPAHIFKACLESYSDKSQGFSKVQLRKYLFIEDAYVEIIGKHEPVKYPVRVGLAGVIRVRPMFNKWSARMTVSYNTIALSAQLVVNLFNQAGYACGICENRPQKTSGNWGRFRVMPGKK